jgi:uncharacterized membrane protein (UPF0127 family)
MNVGHRLLFAGLLMALLMVTSSSAVAQSPTTPPWRIPLDPARVTVNVVVGDDSLLTELAISGDQQTLGLGYRNELKADSAMLFVNDSAAPRTFWMKGMRFCLDIVWIQAGEIAGAAENTCPDPAGTLDQDRARVTSPEPVTYVLEVNAGWLASHGYGVGTKVTIPDLPAG